MTKEFKVTQIFRLQNRGTGASIEIAPDEKQDVFKINMSEESKESLWEFCKDDWKTEKIATVNFFGFAKDGKTLIDPVITHIQYK